MLEKLPVDILYQVIDFNYVIDQKVLRCVSKYFGQIHTSEYVDELKKYSKNFMEMNIAHKENPLHFVICAKDKYSNSISILKNIWWFGINTEFDVRKDKYVILFDMCLPEINKKYELKLSIGHQQFKFLTKNVDDICVIINIKQEGKLKIELDEHSKYKDIAMIKKIICIPYNALGHNIIEDVDNIIPCKHWGEIFQLCEYPSKYFILANI
jgi:hypothetical protein